MIASALATSSLTEPMRQPHWVQLRTACTGTNVKKVQRGPSRILHGRVFVPAAKCERYFHEENERLLLLHSEIVSMPCSSRNLRALL